MTNNLLKKRANFASEETEKTTKIKKV